MYMYLVQIKQIKCEFHYTSVMFSISFVNLAKLLTLTLTLVRQCSILNSSELFSCITMYLNFMFLDQFHF